MRSRLRLPPSILGAQLADESRESLDGSSFPGRAWERDMNALRPGLTGFCFFVRFW
jgi:hypothetical protein